MRRRNEEVTGKPTQYNLQTLEYDWKSLPDNHFEVKENGPRVRPTGADYLPQQRPVSRAPSNEARGRAREGEGMRGIFGGGEQDDRRGGNKAAAAPPRPVPPSPQPAPAPSRPMQEEFYRAAARPANRDDNSNANGNGFRNNNNNNGLDPALLRAVENYPSSNWAGAGGAMGPPSQAPSQQVFVAPWSHEDIKRALFMNQMEANRCYLHQGGR